MVVSRQPSAVSIRFSTAAAPCPVGSVTNRTIGVNLGIFGSILATVDINMPPLQGWILLLNIFLQTYRPYRTKEGFEVFKVSA